MSETLATYNLQILVDITGEVDRPPPASERNQRVLADLPAMLEAIEEDLTDLLPPGYEARIREWSSDE